MLIDISTSKPPSKSYLREHITQLLPTRIQPSFLKAVSEEDKSQKVKVMPNSFLPPHMQGSGKNSKEGVLLAGDALNMRHPLTGGGMSVALNDVVILTELLGAGKSLVRQPKHGNGHGHAMIDSQKEEEVSHAMGASSNTESDTESSHSSSLSSGSGSDSSEDVFGERDICELQDWFDVRSRLEEWHWRRKGVATCVNVLAMALYCLFGAEGECIILYLLLPKWHKGEQKTDGKIPWSVQMQTSMCYGEDASSISYLEATASKDLSACSLREFISLFRNLQSLSLTHPHSVTSAHVPYLTANTNAISRLNPSPPLLLYHFFRVAFYSIYLLFTEPRPSSDGGKPSPPSFFAYPALFWQSIIVVSDDSDFVNQQWFSLLSSY
jgi:hypothetical protein